MTSDLPQNCISLCHQTLMSSKCRTDVMAFFYLDGCSVCHKSSMFNTLALKSKWHSERGILLKWWTSSSTYETLTLISAPLNATSAGAVTQLLSNTMEIRQNVFWLKIYHCLSHIKTFGYFLKYFAYIIYVSLNVLAHRLEHVIFNIRHGRMQPITEHIFVL